MKKLLLLTCIILSGVACERCYIERECYDTDIYVNNVFSHTVRECHDVEVCETRRRIYY